MRKTHLYLLVITLLFIQGTSAYGQTENYKKGLDAIKNDRYHEAMVCFTKVVEDEKFDITGKELSQAYAYLAMIRTAYLEKSMITSDFNSVNQNQGQIQQTIAEMARAVKFQNKSTESLLKPTRKKLEELSIAAIVTLGDTLQAYSVDHPNSTATYLANFAVKEFGALTQLVTDQWQLFDILGLSHYHLGDRDRAMVLFEQGRAQFLKLETQPSSQLHLQNYILSGNYYFKEKYNRQEAYKISNEGSAYTSSLINQLEDNQMKDILKLNKIENRFRLYMTQMGSAE